MDYWKECISEALDDVNIVATPEQIKSLANWIRGAHENYGSAHGHDVIRSNDYQINKIKNELQKEIHKVLCGECKGKGQAISYGPTHQAISECWKCRGEGRHSL